MSDLCVEMNLITILFVDSHPLIQKAWHFLFGQDARFELVGTCETGERAIELTKTLSPDIVIIDTNLKGMSGMEATRKILKDGPDVKVIGLSFDIRHESAMKLIQNGAKGCLTKISSPEEIFKTIIEVQKGETYICKEISTLLF